MLCNSDRIEGPFSLVINLSVFSKSTSHRFRVLKIRNSHRNLSKKKMFRDLDFLWNSQALRARTILNYLVD